MGRVLSCHAQALNAQGVLRTLSYATKKGYRMMREILSVEQPCILCEEPLIATVICRDEETGEEEVRHEGIPHDCLPMKALLKERPKSNYASKKAQRNLGS